MSIWKVLLLTVKCVIYFNGVTRVRQFFDFLKTSSTNVAFGEKLENRKDRPKISISIKLVFTVQ